VRAEAAALAGDGVNPEIFDSIKTAQLLAQTAPGTLLFINNSYLPAPELVFLFLCRAEQQMEVCRVNIAVGKHLSFCQSRQRADDAGLPGAPLTA
jgi:hypothetical protein